MPAVLGRELTSRGHDVTIAAPPGYTEMIDGTGAAYVPLDPDYPRQRLGFMLEDSQVSVVVTQSRFVDRTGRNALSGGPGSFQAIAEVGRAAAASATVFRLWINGLNNG